METVHLNPKIINNVLCKIVGFLFRWLLKSDGDRLEVVVDPALRDCVSTWNTICEDACGFLPT